MNRTTGLFILDGSALSLVYGSEERARIAGLIDVVGPPQTRASLLQCPDLLRQAEVILSGWGAPRLDEAFLAQSPRLKAVFYAGGAIGSWVTQAAWDSGIVISCANEQNAIPVAEYALATILFSLKHGWKLSRETHRQRIFVERNGAPGCYGSTVGLISLGATARTLCGFLRPFHLKIIAHDPYVSEEDAAELGVELTTLEQVFRCSDVVSLHTPLLDETVGMIAGDHLSSMKHGGTFINTARGELVRESEMIDALHRRTDLQVVLDVTADEPPLPSSPLYTLPNVVLTPHIAGSVGKECRRMGRAMVDELERYLKGETLRWMVTPDKAIHTSHQPMRPTKAMTPSGNGNGEHVGELPTKLTTSAA